MSIQDQCVIVTEVYGGPPPVADAVIYLLGDSGKWISGAVMNVSGGFIRAR